MKYRLLILTAALCLLGGCGPEPVPETEAAESYLIPDSYFSYSGTDPEEAREACLELGGEYCTGARTEDGSLILELTEAQRDRMIRRNDDYIAGFLSDFEEAGKLYSYERDESYHRLCFSFDEKIPVMTELSAVFGAAAGCGMNQLLLENTGEWSVELTIYNCHTGREVVSLNIPGDTGSIGPEEWARSYETAPAS